MFAVTSKYMPHHLHKEAARRQMTGGKSSGLPSLEYLYECVFTLHTSEQIQTAIDAVRTVTEQLLKYI